jgi:hypothetical protein
LCRACGKYVVFGMIAKFEVYTSLIINYYEAIYIAIYTNKSS